MDFNTDVFKLLTNGGFTALGLGAWYLMVKYLQKQNRDQLAQIFKLMEDDIKYKELLSVALTRLGQDKDQLAQIFKLMEDDIKYKELLTGILTRLEVKLDYASKEREK